MAHRTLRLLLLLLPLLCGLVACRDKDGPTEPPSDARRRGAVDGLRRRYPVPEVERYLATWRAMDPDAWGDLARIARSSS